METSLEDFLTEHNVPFKREGEHHHASNGWLSCDCPECSPNSGRYRLGIHQEGHAANCWACGPLSAAAALAQLTGLPYPAIRAVLRNTKPATPSTLVKRTGVFRPPARVGPLGERHRQYLQQRGFDPDTVVRWWGVGGIPAASRLAWRLYIPVVYQGVAVSWTTRQLVDGFGVGRGPRYQSASANEEAMHHKTLLYGSDYIRHAAIIVEGPLDAWRIGPGAVATFGVNFTPAQVAQLAEIPVRVICYDNDKPGRKAAKRLAWLLEGLPGRTVVVTLETAKDAGAAAQEEIDDLRKQFLGEE